MNADCALGFGSGRDWPSGLSVIIPTLNEAGSLPRLLPRLQRTIAGIPHEVLIVDDASTDGTADVVEERVATFPGLRVIRRNGPRGLSSSILDGFDAARGAVLAVMDADLQHDPRVLPKLYEAAAQADIVVGSRYAFQGKTCRWSYLREAESRLAALLTRSVLGLGAVRDPLSGFFLLRREVLASIRSLLVGKGWKLLLEILALSPVARVVEVPFTFRPRLRGTTKMNASVARAWLSELVRLRRLCRSLREAPRTSPSFPPNATFTSPFVP